jgi:hypothetical protein
MEALGPSDEIFQELAHQLAASFVGEIALLVEALLRVADHHFGPIDRKHIQEDEGLA